MAVTLTLDRATVDRETTRVKRGARLEFGVAVALAFVAGIAATGIVIIVVILSAGTAS